MEDKKIEIYEEIEETLFYSDELNDIIFDILEDMERYEEDFKFDNFKTNFELKIDFDFEDKIKWLILKEYSQIENLNKINFDDIEKEFFKDIKNIFDKLV